MMTTWIVFTILFVLNYVALFVFVADKRKEYYYEHRISEGALMALSICGGAYGAGMAMLLFQSACDIKNLKIAVPISLVVWIAGIVVFKCLM